MAAVFLVFAAFLVFGGRLFGGESPSATPPPVPSSGDDTGQVDQPGPAPSAPVGDDGRPVGSSGGALPQADGVQAASGGDDPSARPMPPPKRSAPPSWPQQVLYAVLILVACTLFVVAATTLWWMLHAWHSPEALAATGFRRRHAGRP